MGNLPRALAPRPVDLLVRPLQEFISREKASDIVLDELLRVEQLPRR
jgi:hypothetical protein